MKDCVQNELIGISYQIRDQDFRVQVSKVRVTFELGNSDIKNFVRTKICEIFHSVRLKLFHFEVLKISFYFESVLE